MLEQLQDSCDNAFYMISACVSDYPSYRFCVCDNYACASADYQTCEHACDAFSDMFSYLDHY
jgi:hypothetical protein